MMKIIRHIKTVLSGLLIFSLVACGGGGSSAPVGASPPPPPAPPAAAAPAAPVVTLGYGIKQLRFTWAVVAGAAHYRLFERGDASAAFAQVGPDLTATSVNHDIALHRRLNATYRVEACNSVGCTASSPISLTAHLEQAIGYVKASNTGAGDTFGTAVALSADSSTLAIGTLEEDSNATGIDGNQADDSTFYAGAVYVFSRSAGMWSQQAYIKASNTEAIDGFGKSVALSADGNTLAVGTPDEDSNATGIDGNQADNSTTNAGAVYVFTRSAGVWSQQAYVKASNTGAFDGFGETVALSADGSTLAIGANFEDSNATGISGNQADNAATDAGAVYVFIRSAGVWSQQAYIKASNTGVGDHFGTAVALSADGGTLAVGAIFENSSATGINGNQVDTSAPDAGAVYVFIRSAGVWSQQAYIKASNTGVGDFFGSAVALTADGDTLAVGASSEDSSATGINGNQADNSAPDAGAVYVFIRSAGGWSQQAYVKASDTGASDFFGSTAVALSADGSTLAVGARGEDSSATGIDGNQADISASTAGAVYVFARNAGVWSQQAYVKASNTGAIDNFGAAVALSADGGTLAVGARGEDSSATGIGGNQNDNSGDSSGAVYLY